MIGATLTAKQHAGRDGRLPLSIDGCSPPMNSTRPIVSNHKYHYFAYIKSVSIKLI